MSKLKAIIGNTDIDISIDEMVTFIGGDNATGKTLLAKMLKNAKVNNLKAYKMYVDGQEYSFSNIFVYMNELEAKSIYKSNVKNKLIIIDRYDSFSKDTKKEIEKEINKNNNTWIIISRHPDLKVTRGISTNSFKNLVLKKENNKIKINIVNR